MNISFTGRIIAQGQIQMGTSQNGTQWSSCEYTIEELNQQYPARAVFQVFGSDKIQQFNILLGEIITAHIGLKARQSKEGRWFNQLDCWKVERPNGQQQGQLVVIPQRIHFGQVREVEAAAFQAGEVGHDLEPEFGTLCLGNPHPKDLLDAIHGDADGQVDCLV